MKHLTLASFVLLASLSACKSAPDYGRPLPEGAPALLPLGPDDKCPDFAPQWSERADILPALDNSIAWTRKPSSKQFFPIEGVSLERMQSSLERFRSALTESKSGEEFDRRIHDEFIVYKSAGWDAKGGGVLFTAYCTPILDGRLKPDATYKYPLYALPDDLVKEPDGAIKGRRTASGGIEPYPTRHAIEASGMLKNKKLELAWLKDPLDAYIAHVNGSAFIELQDGSMLKLGYAGKNGHDYTSLGQQLVKDKKIGADRISLGAIREWARAHPDELQEYLDRNESFVFVTPIDGDPRGSLNVPVIGNRSLATDKRLFPRGAVVYVEGKPGSGLASGAHLDHFMLDQDTGGAIRTAGRADVYMGSGPEAESVSGATRVEGQLYYLFVRDDLPKP
jgi:membrane-bound lytic murein transglycosylase A